MQVLDRKTILRSIALFSIGITVWLVISRSLSQSFPNLQLYLDIVLILGDALFLYFVLEYMLPASFVPFDALDRRYSLSRLVIDNAPDYVFIKDTAGRYLLANKAYMGLLG